MAAKTPQKRERRVAVFTYKAASPAHARALRDASRKLGIPVAEMAEDGINQLLLSRGLKPLPPRTEGRYKK